MMAVNIPLYQFLFKIAGRQTGAISRVHFTPQKPPFPGGPVQQAFPRALPESQGVSSDFICSFLREMREDPEANPHHVMIARHGNVIAECSFAPYERGMWHAVHSLCKSFTGMACGLLIDEGKLGLDENIYDIFPEYAYPIPRALRKNITIRSLLNMTSGVDFAETGAVTGSKWLASCMSARLKSAPGTAFDYNSMNSYVLSAVVGRRTGMTLADYLGKKLFRPMGIAETFWERGPEGIPETFRERDHEGISETFRERDHEGISETFRERDHEGITKGGWGMYIRPEDALKLGQLYLNKGKWNGRQLISEQWVRESSSVQSDNGKYGYGYQIWMGEREGSYAFEGLFGQYVVVYPDLDMVVLVFAGNREMMGAGHLTKMIRKYFGKGFAPGEALPEDPEAYARLQDLVHEYETFPKTCGPKSVLGHMPEELSAAQRKPEPLIEILSGHRWRMERGNIGILPIVSQVIHNNFTDGIREAGFDRDGGTFILTLREGSDYHRIRVGFQRPERSEIHIHGESWLVGTHARVTMDTENRVTLIVSISFIEDTCTRVLAFHFDGDHMEMRADEIPGSDIIHDAILYSGAVPTSGRSRLVRRIVDGGGKDIAVSAIEAAIRPSDTGNLLIQDSR